MFQFSFSTILLLASLTYIFSYVIFTITETNKDRAYKRLRKLIVITKPKTKKNKEESMIRKTMHIIEIRVTRFVDEQIKKGRLGSLELKLKQAGVHDQTTSQFWAKTIIYGIVGAIIGLVMGKMLFALAFFGLGCYLPYRSLLTKIEKRHYILLNELPDFLDLVSVTFPACSGIEETFELVANRMDSEIAKEFKIVVNELKIGRAKREVFKDLVNRTGIKEIAILVSQINQAETFGTGLEEILVAQAKTIRHGKKVFAEKRGQKATTMMYMPAVLTLMVAMAVIILPFGIQFLENISAFQ